MTVLVTGGSGLVGSHVIEALRARGEPVRALVRPGAGEAVTRLGAEPVAGDVTDPEAWRRAARGARAIIHAAALVSPRDPYERFVTVNVDATRLAARAARAEGARLVHISSVAVYGRTAAVAVGGGRGRVTETFAFQPLHERDFYARTKRLAEDLVQEEAAREGLNVIVLRPNVIYGERDRLFTPKVIRVTRFGIVPLVGPGATHLACVYAGNVAAAVLAAVDAPGGGFRAYNVTEDAPPALDQREFISAFGDALGVRVRRVPISPALARAGVGVWTAWLRLRDPSRYAGLGRAAVSFLMTDNPYVCDRARAELGWRPPFGTREAIARTVAWYRTQARAS
jgi:nucleoside-diphosphate-sugar epimerase